MSAVKELAELKQLLEWQEQRWGSDHGKTLATLEVLADLYQMQGKYGEAEPLYWQILEKKHKLHGSNDLRVADTIYDLACLHEKQENWSECERLYIWSCDIRCRLLPQGDAQIDESLNKVKEIVVKQGHEFDESILPVPGSGASVNASKLDWNAYLERAKMMLLDRNFDFASIYLASLSDVAGAYFVDSREHGECMHLFGRALFFQKRLNESLQAFEKCLAIYEKVFGTNSQDTARCLEDLADVHCKLNAQSEAEFLLQWALQIFESLPDGQQSADKIRTKLSVLPDLCKETESKDSPPAAVENQAAPATNKQDETPEAQPEQIPNFLWQKYMTSGKKALESEDLSTAETMMGLALKQANEFGIQDPRLWESICQMGNVYLAQDRRARAESLYKYALELCQKNRGQMHPDNAKFWEVLAEMYESEGDNYQASICFDKVVTLLAKAGRPLIEYATSLKKLEKLHAKTPASFFE